MYVTRGNVAFKEYLICKDKHKKAEVPTQLQNGHRYFETHILPTKYVQHSTANETWILV